MKTILSLIAFLDKIPSGWKGYFGAVCLVAAAIGITGDYFGEMVELDPLPEMESTWEKVTIAWGLAWAAIGIRHKQSRDSADLKKLIS